MDLACNYKVCTFFFIEALKVWNMLEVVCIELAAFYNFIWLYIIIKYCNLKIISFSFNAVFAYSRISACGVADAAIVIVFEFVLLSLSSFLPQPERAPATNTPVNVSANNFLNVFSWKIPLFLYFPFYFILYIGCPVCTFLTSVCKPPITFRY